MAIIINDQLDSAPGLMSSLSSTGQISGGLDENRARMLAAVLNAGALQQAPELIAARDIPTEE